MIRRIKAELATDTRDKLGEAPAWDARQGRLLWQDHVVGLTREARLDGAGRWHETKRWELNRALACAIPRANGGFIVAGGTEVFKLEESGGISSFANLDADPNLFRANDAKCDPQGRLWVGTLAHDFSARAGLYRVDPDGTVTTMLGNVALANGLDWSPEGKTFYFIDSLALTVDAFDFDGARGTIDNRRTAVRIKHGEGVPNGMAVDREGGLWIALTGGGRVQRYSPDGELLERIDISTPGATSCAFGGENGEILFITSRAGRMPDVAMKLGISADMLDNSGPEAGGLFMCRPGSSGAPANVFSG